MNSYFKEIYDRSAHLRPTPNYAVYPPYHKGDYMEEYFLKYYINTNVESDRILIPVLWTNCYLNFVPGVQDFLNTLDKGKKYFTVSQHDDAIKEILPPNTVTFSAGGNNGQVPIPLICSRILDVPINPREMFCSFVGSATHPIRHTLFQHIKNLCDLRTQNIFYGKWVELSIKDWSPEVSNSDLDKFIDVTSRSKFALCPRGYGRTSYRLYEVMQLGAIPVYVYDTPWIPFTDELDWTEFSVLIGPHDIANIDKILSSISEEKIKQMQAKLIKVYEDYFTLESMCKQIVKRI